MIKKAGSRALAALAVVSRLSATASAQPAPPVPLLIRAPAPDCGATPAFLAFVESLRVELASSGLACCSIVARDTPVSTSAATLDLTTCDPAVDDVGIEAADRARGTARNRRISLADVAQDARPRALALAVAELVRALEQSPVSQAPAPLPAPAGDERSRVSATTGRIAVEADLRIYPGAHTRLWGGRLALAMDHARWRAAVDLGAASGGRSVDLGSIDVGLVSASLAIGPRFLVGAAALDLGLLGELGWARIRGDSAQPGVSTGTGSGLTAAIGGRASLEAPATRSLRLRVVLEAGGVARSLTGNENGAAASGISGAYVLVGVGAGVGL